MINIENLRAAVLAQSVIMASAQENALAVATGWQAAKAKRDALREESMTNPEKIPEAAQAQQVFQGYDEQLRVAEAERIEAERRYMDAVRELDLAQLAVSADLLTDAEIEALKAETIEAISPAVFALADKLAAHEAARLEINSALGGNPYGMTAGVGTLRERGAGVSINHDGIVTAEINGTLRTFRSANAESGIKAVTGSLYYMWRDQQNNESDLSE